MIQNFLKIKTCLALFFAPSLGSDNNKLKKKNEISRNISGKKVFLWRKRGREPQECSARNYVKSPSFHPPNRKKSSWTSKRHGREPQEEASLSNLQRKQGRQRPSKLHEMAIKSPAKMRPSKTMEITWNRHQISGENEAVKDHGNYVKSPSNVRPTKTRP